jgi:transcription initiation factor TFIID subunit 9B
MNPFPSTFNSETHVKSGLSMMIVARVSSFTYLTSSRRRYSHASFFCSPAPDTNRVYRATEVAALTSLTTMADTLPASQPPPPTTTTAIADPNTTSVTLSLDGPSSTSLTDNGTSTRPRDARTIHMVLASLGVTAYQERVPLQLLDFAYRYTSGILADAQQLSAEGYIGPSTTTANAGVEQVARGKKGAPGQDAASDISLPALRLATASRNAYQYASGALPKQTMLEMAGERNKVRLPEVDKDVFFGVRLPHERFLQTGTGWGVPEEWEEEEEEEEEVREEGEMMNGVDHAVNGDASQAVNGVGGEDREEEDQDEDMEDDQEGMDQVFGKDEDGAEDGAMEE